MFDGVMRGLRSAVRGRRPSTRHAALRDEIIRLGPWGYDVEVADGVRTTAWLDAPADDHLRSTGPIPMVARRAAGRDPLAEELGEERFKSLLGGVYPDGLAGRRVLDCACNCGVYLLWAKELGAGESLGFDVREHWVEQARFLSEHRGLRDGVQFEVRDLYDLPSRSLEPFDVTLFKGILYHLPDPVTGLRIAADRTRELLVLNTAVVDGQPNALVANPESAEDFMSGVHGLAWLPTGPEVLRTMLAWCGFPHTRMTLDRAASPGLRRRIEILAARDEEVLARYDGPTAEPS